MKDKIKNNRDHGQAIVEFALALPMILLLVFGIIEFGYLLFSFSSVNTASRDAARYGIAIGDGVVSGQRYYDCQGIVNAGLRVGGFAGMDASDFTIEYDNGPDAGDGSYVVKYATCADLASDGGNDEIRFGDRIKVTVNHDYTPIAALMGVPIQPFTMQSTSTRTIVKNANVGNGSDGAGGVGSGGGGGGGGSNLECHFLTLEFVGQGDFPGFSPRKSVGCDLESQFKAGEVISLTAKPKSPQWTVGDWSGIDSPPSTGYYYTTVTMPSGPKTVSVTYLNQDPDCWPLTTSVAAASTGTGAVPVTSSSSHPKCTAGTFVTGELVTITADPDEGSQVAAWLGTENDSLTSRTNSVRMPEGAHNVEVIYILSLACYELTTTHTGEGIDPIPSAPNCEGTKYAAGTVVSLTATPDTGYEVGGWSGTNFDASTNTFNSVTMDGDKTVSVTYESEAVLDPPAAAVIPNGTGEWFWNASTNECQQIDLRWAYNSSWSPETPVYYEVFRQGTSYGTVSGTHWDANFTIPLGTRITLGVRAVFAGGETSKEVHLTSVCLVNNLDPQDTVVK